jgi:hypothetical protein
MKFLGAAPLTDEKAAEFRKRGYKLQRVSGDGAHDPCE